MVDFKKFDIVLHSLEKYLLKENEYKLLGNNYELILFIPNDKFSLDNKFSLVISSKRLDEFNHKEIIKKLLLNLNSSLPDEIYNSISRINVLHSNDSLVKNLKFMFSFREKFIELNDLRVGGEYIDYACIAKSLILDKLVKDKPLKIEIIDGYDIRSLSVRIIDMDKNFVLTCRKIDENKDVNIEYDDVLRVYDF